MFVFFKKNRKILFQIDLLDNILYDIKIDRKEILENLSKKTQIYFTERHVCTDTIIVFNIVARNFNCFQ